MPSPEEIDKRVEQGVTWITWFAKQWRSSDGVKRFTLLAVLWFVVTNPFGIAALVERVFGAELSENTRWAWWVGCGVGALGFLAAAFVAALRADCRDKEGKPPQPAPVLKWLNSYGPEDAELFRKLQRDRILDACLVFVRSDRLRFGILSGASGCGKTSFLQAGLGPTLKAAGRCYLYVKLTGQSPLAAFQQATGRAAFIPKALGDEVELKQRFDTALAALATGLGAKHPAADGRTCDVGNPLVIVFDQFEQLFAQPEAVQGKFFKELAGWYRSAGELPVKVLLSVREDRVGALTPLQHAMGYTLEPMNNLGLEKFSPEGAARAFREIAGTSGIECDEAFVERELIPGMTDREDGRVSPVDLQVLAWVVAQQPDPALRKFNRAAYQRLGGIEGLLEKYLLDALRARETRERRETAVGVLAALCDFDTGQRAGAKTLPELRAELALSPADVDEAVGWLASFGVRLIAPVTRGADEAFEVVHEKLIPAVRQAAHGLLDDSAKADLLLTRRVNEWLGNSRDGRHLLTRREYRSIRQQMPRLTWGPNRPAKEALLEASRRRLRRTTARWAGGVVAGVFLLAAVGGEVVAYSRAGRAAKDAGDPAVAGGDGLRHEDLLRLKAAVDKIPVRYRWVVRDELRRVARTSTEEGARTAARVRLAVLGFELTGDERARLADWLLEARSDDQFRTAARVLGRLTEDHDELAAYMEQQLSAGPAGTRGPEEKARREATAVVALVRCGRTEPLWSRLRAEPGSDPGLRTTLVHRLDPLDVPPQVLVDRLTADPEPVASERRALLLALGSCRTALPRDAQDRLADKLLAWYRSDPAPGVHGAVWWLLCRWDRKKYEKSLLEADSAAVKTPPGGGRWLVSKSAAGGHHTLADMRLPGGRCAGIGAREVTVDQFQAFRVAVAGLPVVGAKTPAVANPSQVCGPVAPPAVPEGRWPVTGVSWYDAARYCQWLSQKDEMPENEWCYPAWDSPEWDDARRNLTGLKLANPFLSQKGYRLPTAEEWECGCQAGARTEYSFGASPEFLDEYAWSSHNAANQLHPVGEKKPNDFGLFDMHGNVMEWCHDVPAWAELPLGVDNPPDRVLFLVDRARKGGAYNNPPEALKVCWPSSDQAMFRSQSLGFRVARTLRP